MSYQSDLLNKLNAVTVTSYSTDDLHVLTKAFYESPVALGNIPKTFVKALKTRLLDAGTTSARDIGLLTKCINYINFSAFNVASSSTVIPSVNGNVSPAVDSSDLDYPVFTAVYAPVMQEASTFTYRGSSSNAPGGTIVLTPPSVSSTDLFGRQLAGNTFNVGDKLSISFNGNRTGGAQGIPAGYYGGDGPTPNTRDRLFTVLTKISGFTGVGGYTQLTVQDPLTGNVSPGNGAGQALALPIRNFLDDYGAFFTKFGIPARFRVRMWGAGGGGGSDSSYNGTGGGGGSYLEAYVTFDDIQANPLVVVGCGGCGGWYNGGGSSNLAGAGQTSQFAGLFARGGLGGNTYSNSGENGGEPTPLSDKVLYSSRGGRTRYTGVYTGTGGGAAAGPWGSGQNTSYNYGAGTLSAGSSAAGGDSVVYDSGRWYTPALSGFVGGSGATSANGYYAGPGAGGYYSGGIFGGGGATTNSNSNYNQNSYGGNAAGGGGGYAGYSGGHGGHGVIIIEWF
jgi:hypothetical protein